MCPVNGLFSKTPWSVYLNQSKVRFIQAPPPPLPTSFLTLLSLFTIFLPLGGLSFALVFFWGEPQLNYTFPIISPSGVSDCTDFPYSDLLFYVSSCCSMWHVSYCFIRIYTHPSTPKSCVPAPGSPLPPLLCDHSAPCPDTRGVATNHGYKRLRPTLSPIHTDAQGPSRAVEETSCSDGKHPLAHGGSFSAGDSTVASCWCTSSAVHFTSEENSL